MSARVSIIWRVLTVFILGTLFGFIVTVKWFIPPSTEVSIGKLKVKGDNNALDRIFTFTDPAPLDQDPAQVNADTLNIFERIKYRRELRRDKKYIEKRDNPTRRERRRKPRDGVK